ncbi:MAG: hypothetical protein QOK04_1546 [Solirubrobacteraceae bacterium]|nr:hypothetical protein [Solirubrobacteraceae bacterium]
MRGRRRTLAVTCGVVVALAGCGGGGKKQSTGAQTNTSPSAFNQANPTPGVAAGGAGQPAGGGQPAAGNVAASNPFAPSSPWNTPVDSAKVDSNSDTYIRLASLRVGVLESPNQKAIKIVSRQADKRLFVNTTRWTTPVFDEQGGSAVRIVCRQIICGPDANVTSVTIPPDAKPDPRFDGWFTVLNRGAGVAYDLWRARRSGDVISYEYIKKWDLNGPGFSRPVADDPQHAVSARGSGLPLFAGLILPEDIQTGEIGHALAISVPGPAQRNYVQPASVTDGVGRSNSIPEGARIRLRSDVSLGSLPGGTNRRTANAILKALKRFGAIVVDRSAVPTLYAKKNFNWGAQLHGNEVQGLSLDDFEVVELPKVLQDPPLQKNFAGPSVAGAVSGGGS